MWLWYIGKWTEDKSVSAGAFRKSSVFAGWGADWIMCRLLLSLYLHPKLGPHPCWPLCPYLGCFVLSSCSVRSIQIIIFSSRKEIMKKAFLKADSGRALAASGRPSLLVVWRRWYKKSWKEPMAASQPGLPLFHLSGPPCRGKELCSGHAPSLFLVSGLQLVLGLPSLQW